MDNILIATILIIFFTALFSRIVQKHDRVLKSIKNFHITVIQKNNKKMWGIIQIYIKGMKLNFSKPYQSSGGTWVDSYLFYQADMDNVKLILRYHDELSPDNKQRRLQELKKVSKPGHLRRGIRQLRNFISNFQEAFSETLGVFLNQFKSTAGELVKANEKNIKQVGSAAIGAATKEYDQILEHHINREVVLSLEDESDKQEFTGFLAEYSSHWIALINCKIKQDWSLPLNDINRLVLNRSIDLVFTIGFENEAYTLDFELRNFSQQELQIKEIKNHDFINKINKSVSPNESLKIQLTGLPADLFANNPEQILNKEFANIAPERGGQYQQDMFQSFKGKLPDLELIYSCNRTVDIYVPRAVATVRHCVTKK
jgi:hypothetical protein